MGFRAGPNAGLVAGWCWVRYPMVTMPMVMAEASLAVHEVCGINDSVVLCCD